MRHVEQYVKTLEKATVELEEEKQRADLLLYRMLPRFVANAFRNSSCLFSQVATALKCGRKVEPEHYDAVPLMFSDVVKFTNLAARSTPLQVPFSFTCNALNSELKQVVNLLNALYTMFDELIEEHDVYKVETIGDGYLCVSGLPRRNGDQHAGEIADLTLAFMYVISSRDSLATRLSH